MPTPEALIAHIAARRVIAVVTIDDAAHALPLADALLAGGVRILELTFRTPAAPECLRRIAGERPNLVVGAGTVLDRRQVDEAQACGAAFAVSPGHQREVIQHAQSAGLPFYPGVMTPYDVEATLALGCRLLKFFPAENAGGPGMLKALARPYEHTGVKFIPLGGVTADNMANYLKLPVVAAIGGSWIAERSLIRNGQFDEIKQRAAACVARIAPIA